MNTNTLQVIEVTGSYSPYWPYWPSFNWETSEIIKVGFYWSYKIEGKVIYSHLELSHVLIFAINYETVNLNRDITFFLNFASITKMVK